MLVLTLIFLFLLTRLPAFQWKGISTKPVDLFSDIRVDGALLDFPGDGEWQEEMDEHALPQEMADSISAEMTAVHRSTGDMPAPKQASVKLITDSATVDAPPRIAGGVVLLEDFSADTTGLSHFLSALRCDTLGRPVRIGFLGDSFIEGDIFTQDVRAQLQTRYGGRGVGYMPLFSEIPGFRRSVVQTTSGWDVYSILKPREMDWSVMTLHQQYFIPLSGANASYQGSNRVARTDSWNCSRLVFLAPQDCSVDLKIGGGSWQTFAVTGSPELQSLIVKGETSSFLVRANHIPDFAAVGVWLDNEQGIAVDNVSSRGYSGLSLASISPNRAAQMEQIVPYDLLVLQYGLNIITPEIHHYEAYARKMVGVIQHLQECYPNTDIILMGVGDRCQKTNGVITTMPAITGLVKAQRMAARTAGVVFWDTFQAMGGQNGIISYVENEEANKDYTHINHKGGKRLATEFVKSLQYAIDSWEK